MEEWKEIATLFEYKMVDDRLGRLIRVKRSTTEYFVSDSLWSDLSFVLDTDDKKIKECISILDDDKPIKAQVKNDINEYVNHSKFENRIFK